MSSAKRISIEDVIQQVGGEDFDYIFENSSSDDDNNDVDIGNNHYGDTHDNTDNEIRTHGVSDSKISNYSSLILVTIKFFVQDAKPSDEDESNEQGSSMSCTDIVSESHTQHRDGSSCDESRLWTSVPSEVQEHPFTNNVGPTIPISDDDNLFLKFFPHELISHIVNETNKYAKECLKSTDGSNPKQWD